VKWQIAVGRTYNPDFECRALGCFIEVVTSVQNIAAAKENWKRAIALGNPLRIFWWEGQEILVKELDYLPRSEAGWWKRLPLGRRKARRAAGKMA
jgi:hypothetical protein